jgi:triacylglycerol lipase
VFGGLSPRRRALVIGVLLVVAVGAIFVIAWAGGRLAERRSPEAAPPQDRAGPALLVPGYGGGTGGLRVLAERIRAAGGRAVVVELPGDGTGDLRQQARALDRAVSGALRAGAPSVDVIGYSAGGVTARLWAHDYDGMRKARRIITLGSPHHGAEIATAGEVLAPGICPPACQELVPGSALLSGLGDRAPARPAMMSIWSAADQTVTPPASARLAGAVDVPLQSVCAGTRTGHGELPTDPLVTGIVLRALGPAPLRAPGPADCAALRSVGR